MSHESYDYWKVMVIKLDFIIERRCLTILKLIECLFMDQNLLVGVLKRVGGKRGIKICDAKMKQN